MSKDECCKGCERFHLPYMDEEGKMRTCRQECPDWKDHEKERRETYEERMRRIRGDVGISPEREKNRRKITMMIKQGKGR